MSDLEKLREEMLRRQAKKIQEEAAVVAFDVKAAAGSDPQAARDARERIERRDRETAQRLAAEYMRERRTR